MKKYSSAVLALILTSTCMTASAATQEISKKAYVDLPLYFQTSVIT
ncbi:hypothetical protein [Escherichia coli]|nr:hypothetical protein [Escherichia coli]MCU6846816.1 hypothetical protein [Escherichia coli]WFZ92091.1 hypothetical protein NFK80_24695 [Escherichia coli]SVF75469.1 Uncharacterised protein [Escherichia coli]